MGKFEFVRCLVDQFFQEYVSVVCCVLSGEVGDVNDAVDMGLGGMADCLKAAVTVVAELLKSCRSASSNNLQLQHTL